MGKYVTGGIMSVILNYYNEIDKDIFQFDLIIDKDSPENDYSKFTSKGARIYKVTPINKNPYKNIIETKKILETNNYYLIHSYLNTLNIFPMFAGYLAKTEIRIAENLSTAHPKEPKTVYKNMLKPFGKLFATSLAANSEYAAKWLYGEKKLSEVKIIRNGLDLNYFSYDPELRKDKRKELGIREDTFILGHIGRYQFQKNHSFLIDIFNDIHKKNSNTKLLLIGYGELKEEIWGKISNLNLEDYIIDGGASIDNVANYNAMDCFVMPSYYEGLPVVGIEAQATGLPCVFSTEVTNETKVIEAVSFLSLDDPLSEWSEKILSFQNTIRKDAKEQLTNKGYNIEIEAQKLTNYYKNKI